MSRVHGITLAVVMALGGMASSASADGTIRRDVQVSYGDLSISTEAGANALLDRIDHAARQACGGSPYFHPMYSLMPDRVIGEFNACRHNAVAKAVREVGSPVLARVYAEKGERNFERFAGR